MGRSYTPAYRVEYSDQGGKHQTAWSGPTTIERLALWIQAGIDSMKVGGCNEHVSKSLGYLPVPHKARIIRQATGETVATWKAPAFMAI